MFGSPLPLFTLSNDLTKYKFDGKLGLSSSNAFEVRYLVELSSSLIP